MTETATFTEKLETVGIGTKYEEVELEDRTIRKGDVVLIDDKEISDRDIENGIHSRTYIGWVESVLDPDSGGEPMIFTSAEIGRVDASDAEVSGEGSRVDPQTGLTKFVDQFLNRYDDWMTMEWGEDINGTGEDHRRTGE